MEENSVHWGSFSCGFAAFVNVGGGGGAVDDIATWSGRGVGCSSCGNGTCSTSVDALVAVIVLDIMKSCVDVGGGDWDEKRERKRVCLLWEVFPDVGENWQCATYQESKI